MNDSADYLLNDGAELPTSFWRSMSLILIAILVTFGLSLLCIAFLLQMLYDRTTIHLLSFMGLFFLWSAWVFLLTVVMHEQCTAWRSHDYYKVDENATDKVDICLVSNCNCSEFSLNDSAVRFEMCVCGHPRNSHVILSSENEYFEHPDNLRHWIQADTNGIHSDDHVVV